MVSLKKDFEDMAKKLNDLEKTLQLFKTQRDAYHKRLNSIERRLQAELNKRNCSCGRQMVSYCPMCDGPGEKL